MPINRLPSNHTNPSHPNTQHKQIQFAIDKPALESFGFAMTPEGNVKLAGAPECEVSVQQLQQQP